MQAKVIFIKESLINYAKKSPFF